MFLDYKNKKTEKEIIENVEIVDFDKSFKVGENYLIKGDNLPILKTLVKKYKLKVDLIYIDPPFSTNNVFKIGDKRANTISSKTDDKIAYSDNLKGPEFLEFLRERLIFAREILSEEGSIYFIIYM